MKFRMELHCHTEQSFDGFTTPEQLADACYRKGINVVAITEHDKIPDVSYKGFKAYGIAVISACEFTSDQGAHIIGLFVDKGLTSGASIEEIFDCILGQNGLVLIPHPFKPCSGLCALYDDCNDYLKKSSLIELYNGGYRNTSEEVVRIVELAERFRLKLVAASDSHKVDQIGYYITEFQASEGVALKELLLNVQGKLFIDSGYSKPPRSLAGIQRAKLYQVLVKKAPYWIKRALKRYMYRRGYSGYRPGQGNYTMLRM